MKKWSPICATLLVFAGFQIVGCDNEVRVNGSGGTGGSGKTPTTTGLQQAPTTTTGAQQAPTTTGGMQLVHDCSSVDQFSIPTHCEANNEGTVCSFDYADTSFCCKLYVECKDGDWVNTACPYIDAHLQCAEAGVHIQPCDPGWEGNTCPWYWTDGGESCGGVAQCTNGDWVSLSAFPGTPASSSSTGF